MADVASILGIVVEAWRSWRSKLLGWLGNPGKHRRDPDFRSEAPRIVLLVVRVPSVPHKEILGPFSLSPL